MRSRSGVPGVSRSRKGDFEVVAYELWIRRKNHPACKRFQRFSTDGVGDVAIIVDSERLMGKKPKKISWRFIYTTR